MRIVNWLLVIIGILGLIAVRFFERPFFYDPFLNYFHDSSGSNFPEFSWILLIINHLFRFGLNLLFSLIIIHFLFRNFRWTIQGAVLILIVFAVTFPVYLYCLDTQMKMGELFTFYMRRFVIQPVILLLIIPLFYYRQHMQRHNN